MLRVIYSFCLGSALVGITGCGSAPVDPLKRQPISGQVTLDEKPVDEGMIAFAPVAAADAETATAAVITAGKYEIPKESGLAPGTYKVKISSPEPGPQRTGDDLMNNPGPPRRERVAAKFNLKSELQATVTAAAPNKFDFSVTSK